MRLKTINLPEKLNFPVLITDVHVIAGQMVSNGDPIYTLETADQKRGILRAPYAGEIVETPVPAGTSFDAPAPIIDILTEVPKVPDPSEEVVNRGNEQETEPSRHEPAAPKPEDRLQQAAHAARPGFLSILIGAVAFLFIGAIAALLPGVLFSLFGARPTLDPQFLTHLAGIGVALILFTMVLSLAKVFGGRVVLPMLGAISIFGGAFASGFVSDKVRDLQISAVEPAMEFAESAFGKQFVAASKKTTESRQMTQLPGAEKILESLGNDPYYGEVRAFAFNFCPRGWADANGVLLKISSNHELFSLYGTTFGGDGRTTFGLPDLRGRQIIGPKKSESFISSNLGSRSGADYVQLRSGNNSVLAGHSILAVKYCVALIGDYPSRN